jgi:cytochrome c556
MMNMTMKLKSAALIVAASMLLPIASSSAADPDELIKYRKNVMKVIGGHTGSLFAIAGGKAGDASHMEAHVSGLVGATMMAKDLFAEESQEGETRASAQIWMDPEGFAAAIKEMEDAATGIQVAFESSGDMGAALRALGASCKGCHDDYRTD